MCSWHVKLYLLAVQETQQRQDGYWQLLCAMESIHHPSDDWDTGGNVPQIAPLLCKYTCTVTVSSFTNSISHNPMLTWFWGATYILNLNVITKTYLLCKTLMLNTYGSSPNPQASWMQLEHLKLTREGSAPASRRMDTDLFLWATMAHCSAVLPLLSYSCWK